MPHVLVLLLAVMACDRGPREAPATTRVVSLTPSATEIVAALGATELLVGVDSYSKYPPGVERLPKVGDFIHPNLEAIVRLSPTLVIVDDVHGTTASALHDRGIATVTCGMHAIADVESALHAVGARLGRDAQATALVADLERAIAEARARRPAHHPRVLLVIDRAAGDLTNLVAAGPGSWLDELLVIVGGDNVLAGADRYPKISVEEVVRARPDVILDVSFADPGTSAWRSLDVPAVHADAVFRLSQPVLLGPTPRIREALAALAPIVAAH
jgi:iron complex transport system substrate-binding protein